jgi:exonuclease I
LPPEMIRTAIYPAVQTMDRYLPGPMSVIYTNITPAEAVAEVEGEAIPTALLTIPSLCVK